MMTAEQYVRAILKPDPNEPEADTFYLHFPDAVELVECREFWLKHLTALLDDHAAAQLAEKERLQNETYEAFSKADDERERQWRRAEAAEQRLQEAQAELDKCRDRWVKRAVSAEDRLRQREAELEHAVMCMDRSCKRCNAAIPAPLKEGD